MEEEKEEEEVYGSEGEEPEIYVEEEQEEEAEVVEEKEEEVASEYSGCPLETVTNGQWTDPYGSATYWILECNQGYVISNLYTNDLLKFNYSPVFLVL